MSVGPIAEYMRGRTTEPHGGLHRHRLDVGDATYAVGAEQLLSFGLAREAFHALHVSGPQHSCGR